MGENRTRHLAWLRLLGALGMIALLLGCAAGRGYDPVQLGLAEQRSMVSGLQPFEQAPGQCGAAALATVLQWTGREVPPSILASMVYDPQRRGSLQASMKAAARRYGRLAYIIEGQRELLAEVAAGHPVIVLQNLGLSWHPVHHYAVVAGFDLEQDVLFLLSGETSPEKQSVRVFDATWSRAGKWGLVVLPPDESPARPEQDRYLQAILGLEQAGRFQAAATGYQAFLRLWPAEQTALLGLANTRYATGDVQGAAQTLIQGAEAHPGSAVLQNNLAHVLMEQGHLDRALAAARKAVSLGGPHLAASRQTLKQIRELRSAKDRTGADRSLGAGP